jgi:hypothetical protein
MTSAMRRRSPRRCNGRAASDEKCHNDDKPGRRPLFPDKAGSSENGFSSFPPYCPNSCGSDGQRCRAAHSSTTCSNCGRKVIKKVKRCPRTSQVRAGPSGHANSPHPSSREGHLSTARRNLGFLLSDLIFHGCHAAAAACSRVQRNSVPSTHMRCMITANRRASATIAFFIPRRLAICIAQALSQDHFFERIIA